MQITFVRWCMDPKGRTPVSVDPSRVDCVEHYGEQFSGPLGDFPAASRIIMKGKQEYVVQGTLYEVVDLLNGGSHELEG